MRNRATTPLKKAKVRQSWSKYNLYNLSRLTLPSQRIGTFFQQKWQAKSILRNYHGEQVREGQWKRMFRRRLPAVVPMDPAYLAVNDGSNESAGRGSGLTKHEFQRKSEKRAIPYMNMTFTPLERRLDTAIFRAMFASSARQARQFVVHGAVKVNGKKMRYPGYLLNPGDMFQVEPERVMYATGIPKPPGLPSADDAEEGKIDEGGEELVPETQAEDESDDADLEREPKEVLKDLLLQAKSILGASRDKLGAKRKQDLRAFSSTIKRMLSRASSSTIATDSLEAQWQEIQNQLRLSREQGKGSKTSSPLRSDGQKRKEDKVEEVARDLEKAELDDALSISNDEYNQLYAALREAQDNPIDESKPYSTPWMPRDYMSAFAHIPRYLEVNQNICAAVYLRHPVAKPGLAEIPTPFPPSVNGTAYVWYLRRR